jgi:serine/threonine-protein kinase
MSGPQSIDRPTFLAHLRQSGLLTPGQLEEIEHQLPTINRGRAVARLLVDRGLLTRFQAERLLIGRTAGFILGQYRILDQIGRGGMGRVYKAEHRTMGRVVALKVLAPELMKTDRALELFLREVRAAARLIHPNVVHAYDANESLGRHYLVMEFVDGPNLDHLVRERGPLPVGPACDYIRQAATGLTAAHAIGMVHRDIKPANVLLHRPGSDPDSPGLVKISDFGLARLQAPDTRTTAAGSHAGTILLRENTVMGTPDFLSPEQAKDLHATDIRSDLYSLGCTFYYLLAGRVPFPGGTTLDKLIRHSSEVAEPLSAVRPDLPGGVGAIVRRLMAKDPAARFQTPGELVQALEPHAVGGPIPWAPPAPPQLDDLDDSSERAAVPAKTIAVSPGEMEKVITPSDLHFDVGSNEELPALGNTVPANPALTPLTPPESPPPRRPRPPSGSLPAQYPPSRAVAWATALVCAGLGLVFWLSWLLGG